MTSRPIIFSAPMVRALLDSSKTQTRRVVKPQPERREIEQAGRMLGFKKRQGDGFWLWPNAREQILAECPHGQPGDQLLVRETYFAWGRWETRYSPKKKRDEWHFVDMTVEGGRPYLYAADGLEGSGPKQAKRHGGIEPMYWKRPAIFMPRAVSRITLEITGVRVERLQDISDEDSLAEGIYPTATGLYPGSPKAAYQKLDKRWGANACRMAEIGLGILKARRNFRKAWPASRFANAAQVKIDGVPDVLGRAWIMTLRVSVHLRPSSYHASHYWVPGTPSIALAITTVDSTDLHRHPTEPSYTVKSTCVMAPALSAGVRGNNTSFRPCLLQFQHVA